MRACTCAVDFIAAAQINLAVDKDFARIRGLVGALNNLPRARCSEGDGKTVLQFERVGCGHMLGCGVMGDLVCRHTQG